MSSIAQIKDSAYDGLKSLTVYGNTVQNLWVNPEGTANGITCTANNDGTVTVSGTASAQYATVSINTYILKPSTTYYLSIDKNATPSDAYFYVRENAASGNVAHYLGGNGTGVTNSFTTKSDISSAVFAFCVNTVGHTPTGTYRVMLNEGSTAEPWCPPGLNSVDKLSIVTAGKNLVDASSMTINKAVNTETGVIYTTATSGNWYATETKIPCPPPGSSVVCSAGSSHRSSIAFYFGNGTFISGKSISKTEVAIVPDGASLMAIDVYKDYLSNFQLELGSTATSYEPPSITTTPIDLQGHTLNALPDGTRDELHIDGGGNVVLEKRTQTVQLDGDGSWSRNETPFVHYVSSWTNYDGLQSGYTTKKHYSDKLPASSNVPNGIYSAGVNGASAYLREPTFASDATGVKTWMGANTPTVIMPLVEPQTIDLGTVDLPKLRKKPLVNTIWANGTAEGTGFSLAPEIDCEYNRWSTYCDGFKTNGKHSYFDMGCCIAARDTGTPEKKSVTATVPYMSGFYDLSKLYGAIAFEARQLMYRLEFVEDSREELQQKKSQFLEWLSQVHDEEIADDDIPGRHFIGSLSEWEFEEGEEGQSGSLEVTFNCQPFLEADMDTTATLKAGANTVTVKGQPVNAYAKCASGTATIQIGGVTQSVGTSEIRLSVQLQPGDNAVTVTGSPVVLRWKELTA